MKKFTKFMIGYAVVLLVLVIGVLVYEWNILSDYQDRYDESEKNSNPQLFVDEYLSNLSEEDYRDIIEKKLTIDNIFYSRDEIVSNLTDEYKESGAVAVKAEQWSEGRPVYNIISGDKIILKMTLRVASKDEFGFNNWQVDTIAPYFDYTYGESVDFVISNQMKAKINGVEVTDKFIKNEIEKNYYSKNISQCMGSEFKVNRYHIDNLKNDYELVVTDLDGNILSEYKENYGVKDYVEGSENTEDGAVYQRISYVMDRYLYYINNMEPLENMQACVEPGSDLYKTITSTYNGAIMYVIKPISLEKTKSEITDMVIYSKDTIVCKVDYAYEKKFSGGLVYEEWGSDTANFILVMKKIDGQWVLQKMENYQ